MTVRLSNSTLKDLPADVRIPGYDRAGLTPGIVHIGMGNFHRAHQAWYLHRLMDMGLAGDWGILGAGVMPADAVRRERLIAQDCLTTLIELDSSGVSAEVVGSIVGFLPVEPDNARLIEAMAAPEIRIVGLTVTEGGYYLNADGGFDSAHPDIVHDAANPESPRTAFGAMVAALAIRRAAGEEPFTGLSCDNLQGNGAILRRAVSGLARLSDPSLGDWIEDRAGFPDSMVDCIVPATGERELGLARELGVDDAAPVTHESFRQWVIEDDFRSGRPDWDRAGAIFTDDVRAYETMKLSMLNAGHQLLANVGELLSVNTISGAMAHGGIRAFFDRVERREIAPLVAPVPEATPEDYIDLITRRFANSAIVDTVRRVAFDGSSRHPGFVVPILREGLRADSPVEGLALAEAFWARMCAGTRENGEPIEPNDPRWEELNARALGARGNPGRWLEMDRVYGDLGRDARFAKLFSDWLDLIWNEGAEAALARHAGS